MCHWFETIKIENGLAVNLEWHQKRVDSTLLDHGITPHFKLQDFFNAIGLSAEGIHRLKIVYNQKIVDHSILNYVPGTLDTLKVVEDNHLTYSYKDTDRRRLEFLKSCREDCDDVLIIKNGQVTDISYANIVFCSEKGFFSPVKPLLRGTQISLLAQQRIVHLREIRPSDFHHFTGWVPVNALLGFKPDKSRLMDSIRF